MTAIGVFQSWGLGDLVMTVPVLAELRRLHPTARIVLIVRGAPQGELLRGSPLVDEILQVPRRHNDIRQLAFYLGLRRRRLDAVYLGTRVFPQVAFMLRAVAGVRTIIGDGERWPSLYTVRNTVEPGIHRVDRMLRTLALWTGITVERPDFPLPVTADARRAIVDRLAAGGWRFARHLAFHPGSSRGRGDEKRMPAALVRDTLAALRVRHPDLGVVLLFGPAEADLLPQLEPLPEGVVALVGAPLAQTMAVLAGAVGFIGSDSGLGHVAAAFGVPTVTPAGPSNPVETRPWGDRAEVVVSREDLPCRPCWFTPLHGACPYDARCMTTITADQILDALRLLPAPPHPLIEPDGGGGGEWTRSR